MPHLSVHSIKYFLLAVIWTTIVTYFCLKERLLLPSGLPKYADKIGHAIFHFGIVGFWFLALKPIYKSLAVEKLLYRCIFISVFFGLIIESCQAFFTETRSADWQDVAANCVGTILAALILLIAVDKQY